MGFASQETGNSFVLQQGKPVERRGRKVTGLMELLFQRQRDRQSNETGISCIAPRAALLHHLDSSVPGPADGCTCKPDEVMNAINAAASKNTSRYGVNGRFWSSRPSSRALRPAFPRQPFAASAGDSLADAGSDCVARSRRNAFANMCEVACAHLRGFLAALLRRFVTAHLRNFLAALLRAGRTDCLTGLWCAETRGVFQ